MSIRCAAKFHKDACRLHDKVFNPQSAQVEKETPYSNGSTRKEPQHCRPRCPKWSFALDSWSRELGAVLRLSLDVSRSHANDTEDVSQMRRGCCQHAVKMLSRRCKQVVSMLGKVAFKGQLCLAMWGSNLRSRRGRGVVRWLCFALALGLLGRCFTTKSLGLKGATQRDRGLSRRASALEYAQSLAGPGSRELLEEFKKTYRQNPYPEKLSLFFPDHDRIIETLYSSTRNGNYTEIIFLRKVDKVFRQLYAFGPSAWPGLEKLLSSEHPWTEAYCKKIIAAGADVWNPFEFFQVSLDGLAPLQRYSLQELQDQSITGYRVLERWLQSLEKSKDPTILDLLHKLKTQASLVAGCPQSLRYFLLLLSGPREPRGTGKRASGLRT